MENSNNKLWPDKIVEFIERRNFYLYTLLFSMIIMSPILINPIRQNFGIAPILVSFTFTLLLMFFRYSIKNSVNFLSYKAIISILLINISIYISLGSINYVSSSSFSFDYSLSGKSGEFLAKSPSYWNNYNANILNYFDLSLRIFFPLLLLLMIYKPHLFKNVLVYSTQNTLYLVSRSIKKINLKRSKEKKEDLDLYETKSLKNQEVAVEEKIINKDSTESFPKSKQNVENEEKVFIGNDNKFELNKTISFEENYDEQQIDKFKIENFKWPKITTSNLMVSEKHELSKQEIEDTKKS